MLLISQPYPNPSSINLQRVEMENDSTSATFSNYTIGDI